MQESEAGWPPYDARELFVFETIKTLGYFFLGGGGYTEFEKEIAFISTALDEHNNLFIVNHNIFSVDTTIILI